MLLLRRGKVSLKDSFQVEKFALVGDLLVLVHGVPCQRGSPSSWHVTMLQHSLLTLG